MLDYNVAFSLESISLLSQPNLSLCPDEGEFFAVEKRITIKQFSYKTTCGLIYLNLRLNCTLLPRPSRCYTLFRAFLVHPYPYPLKKKEAKIGLSTVRFLVNSNVQIYRSPN